MNEDFPESVKVQFPVYGRRWGIENDFITFYPEQSRCGGSINVVAFKFSNEAGVWGLDFDDLIKMVELGKYHRGIKDE